VRTLFSLAQRRCADPERAKAHSDAATPPGYHWFLPMEQRPAKANRPNLQGIHNLQLSRPEPTPLEPHPTAARTGANAVANDWKQSRSTHQEHGQRLPVSDRTGHADAVMPGASTPDGHTADRRKRGPRPACRTGEMPRYSASLDE
jgi:hypothetical protein